MLLILIPIDFSATRLTCYLTDWQKRRDWRQEKQAQSPFQREKKRCVDVT